MSGKFLIMPAWYRLALALFFVGAATALRYYLLQDLCPSAPYFTFFFAVVFSSLIGGLPAGLLAMTLSILASLWLQPVSEPFAFFPGVWPSRTLAFIIIGTTVSWLSQILHRIRFKAAESESLRKIVAERDNAIGELRKSQAVLSSVIESLPFDFWAVAPNGRYFLQNTHATKVWGDLSGKRPDELELGPEVSRSWLDANTRALAGATVRHEARFERLGQERVFDMVVAPIRDNDRILGALGVNMDITEHKRTEEALFLAKCSAEAANKTKSEFLANMSHEIRTPLGGVLAMLQFLESEELSPQQRECVSMAVQAGHNLMNILNDILDLSKIEAGRMEVFEEVYAPRELMASVRAMFAHQARQKGLDLSCLVAQAVPEALLGDVVRLRQILFNLLGNAIKFTPTGRVSMELYPDQSQTRLCFKVSDTGIGIAPDKLQAVFEPFIQADGTLRRGYQGTGLGLSIVKRLADLMHGSIELTSPPEKGTVALFTVPLRPATPTSPDMPRDHALPGPFKAHILLVEDDNLSQIAAKRLLEKRSQSVICAGNGREALDILTRREVDVVLMDVQMPVMDGIETLGRIRAGEAGEANKAVFIVALTAHAMRGDEETLLKAGFDGYLAKPLDVNRFMAMLEEFLNR